MSHTELPRTTSWNVVILTKSKINVLFYPSTDGWTDFKSESNVKFKAERVCTVWRGTSF